MRSRATATPSGRLLTATLLVLALAPAAAAQATTQTRDDPSDAPAGPSGTADLRTLSWDVGASSASLTVSVDQSTYGAALRAQIGVHVLMDTNGDALADKEIVATRSADGLRVDVKLRDLSQIASTADCQELGGTDKAAATIDTTIAGGLESFTFAFDPAAVSPAITTFRWAAFAQAPPASASAGPWDLMPDAGNPNPGAVNPGERDCGVAKTGLSVRIGDGVAFPDVVTPPPPSAPPFPVVVLAMPGGQPPAGGVATIDARGTTIAPGAHVVAYQWDVDGDGHIDTNTGTNPVVHLPTSSHSHNVHVTVLDSNDNAGAGVITIDPGTARAHCDTEASIRILRITAGCITKVADVTTASGFVSNQEWDRYVVEMNGLSFVTSDPAATVTFDEEHNAIVGHGDFTVKSLNSPSGDIEWYSTGPDGFHWPMPSGTRGTARIVSLGVSNHCDDSEATKCHKVEGFPVTGQIGVGIDTGTLDAVLDVELTISSGIDVTTGVRLRMNLALGGLALDQLRFRIENATFGVVTLKRLSFVFDPPGTGDPVHEGGRWDVAVGIELTTPHIAVNGRMIFVDGQFNYSSTDILFTPGILLYAGIFMNHFGASFGINPTRVGGLLGLSFVSVLQLDGSWDFLHLADGTNALSLTGHASFVSGAGEIARLEMQFWNDGYFSYSGRIGYSFPSTHPVFEIFGQTDFWVEAEPHGERARYQGHGQLAVAFHSVNIASMEMFINNDWAAGCGFGMRGIHSYHPGVEDVVQIVLAHCDVDDYTIQPTRAHDGILPGDSRSLTATPALAAPEGRSFTVAPGQRALVLQVGGVGGAPRLALADPKGRIYTPTTTPNTTRPVVDGSFSSAYLTDGGITLLRVEKPIAGTWVLTPQPGSPAIATVTRSNAMAPLNVKARVTGSGRTRTLTWDAPGLGGRTIRFLERGANVGHTIVVTKKEHGTVRWALQSGSAGKRTVQAQVTAANGIPAGTPVVAHFTAPGPPRPIRVGRVAIRRVGENVSVRWPRLRAADGYTVRVLGSDGRREVYFPAAQTPTITTLRVAPSTKLTVRVAAWIDNRAMTGPTRTAKLAAVKPRKAPSPEARPNSASPTK